MTVEEPDFRALYEPAFRRGSSMSPRMAHRLWRAAVDLADAWRQIRPIERFLVEDLPPVARPWAEGEWLDRFAGCFEALAVRIAAGEGDQETLASCTGEELALHLVIEQARGDATDDLLIDDTAGLPVHAAADTDFELMRDLLFVDHDVLLLFEPSLDGIEGEEASLAPWVEMVNLHPRDWFLPFETS